MAERRINLFLLFTGARTRRYIAMMENLQSISSRPVAEAVPSGYGGRKVVDKSLGIQGDTLDLSPEAEAQLRKLKQRDAEVRAHERAHMAAAGGNAVGGPHYEYQKGPDGKQYAIGGHVDISLSSVDGDPEENEKNAQEVRRAALAAKRWNTSINMSIKW